MTWNSIDLDAESRSYHGYFRLVTGADQNGEALENDGERQLVLNLDRNIASHSGSFMGRSLPSPTNH